jgi:hypothetical protein
VDVINRAIRQGEQECSEDVQLLAGHKWLLTTEKYKRQDNKKSVEMINRFFPI